MTLSEIKTAVGNMIKDISDLPDATFIQFANFSEDYIYRRLADQAADLLASETTFSLTSGTSSYALPDDFGTITPSNCGFFLLGDDGTVSSKLTKTTFGSKSYGYYLDNANVVFTPPNTTTQSIKLRYIPERTRFTALTDDFSLPDRFEELYMNSILKYYYQWDSDSANEQMADQRFTRTLNQMMNDLDRDTEVFTMPTDNSNYSAKTPYDL